MSAMRKLRRNKARNIMKRKGFIRLNKGKPSIFAQKWRDYA